MCPPIRGVIVIYFVHLYKQVSLVYNFLLTDLNLWPDETHMILTILRRVDSAIATVWTGLFPVKMCVYLPLSITKFYRKS